MVSCFITIFAMKLDDVSAENSGLLCTSFARHFIASVGCISAIQTSSMALDLHNTCIVLEDRKTKVLCAQDISLIALEPKHKEQPPSFPP